MPTIDSGLWSSIRRNWTQSQMWSSRAQRGAVSYPSRAFFQIKYCGAMFRVAQTTALPSGLHHLGQIIITPLLHSRISILGFWIITTGRGGVMAELWRSGQTWSALWWGWASSSGFGAAFQVLVTRKGRRLGFFMLSVLSKWFIYAKYQTSQQRNAWLRNEQCATGLLQLPSCLSCQTPTPIPQVNGRLENAETKFMETPRPRPGPIWTCFVIWGWQTNFYFKVFQNV